MEARIRELEKAGPREVIDVDAAAENTMVVFEAIESLRKDTEEGWNKLAVPLDRVIEANNASTVGIKKRDVQLARREDIMDGRVSANRVKIDELNAKVTLGILDASVEYLHRLLDQQPGGGVDHPPSPSGGQRARPMPLWSTGDFRVVLCRDRKSVV